MKTRPDKPSGPSGVRLSQVHLARENSTLRQENDRLRQHVASLQDYVQLALTDYLTGLPNGRYFDRRIREEMARARRYAGVPCSLLVVDVNDFKRVNDTRGHGVGDEVLKWVAHLLETARRHEDVCCRIGGDEFVVILPATGEAGAESVVGRLRAAVAAAAPCCGFRIGVSIGASTFGCAGTTVEALFDAADEAMYRDKQRQKGQDLPRRRANRLESVRSTVEIFRVVAMPAS